MGNYAEIIKKVQTVEHGFKQMKEEAEAVAAKNNPEGCLKIAKDLYSSEFHQVRMTAVFIMGMIAAESKEALDFMHDKVSLDESWQVQEILAQAFDNYCKDIGYEKSLPIIKKWISDKNPNVRRAVSEGLRIWNYKDYFKQNPEIAIQLLSQLKDDESEYVRKSAGNAIRDISRKEKELVKKELSTWNVTHPYIKQVHELAGKFL
jgi:3-methyladenine DNA glycosylase AlkD